ncbi:MAG: hypothetical protein ACU84Q_00055 [Gammaproteobacteria bacterium]
MAEKRLDVSVLRGALGVFAICLVIAGLMLAASVYFRDQMSDEYQTHQARFRDVSRKYLSVDEEESIIAEYLPSFRALYAKGILGQERRLSWLESLKFAGEEVKPPKLGYEIRAQNELDHGFPINTGSFDIRTSEMELTMGLLHEEDLFNILAVLDREAAGLFSVSSCELKRAGVTHRSNALAEQIEAICKLRWYTLDLKGDRKLSL